MIIYVTKQYLKLPIMNILLIAGIVFLYLFLLGLAGDLDRKFQKRNEEF